MMKEAMIKKTENGFSVVGKVHFDSVMMLREQGECYIADASEIHVDFSEAVAADSAGLALMLAWLRSAKHQQTQLSFHHVPSLLCEVAAVCNLDQLLGLSLVHG